MDKILENKTFTIRKPPDLNSLSDEEINNLKYSGDDDAKILIL